MIPTPDIRILNPNIRIIIGALNAVLGTFITVELFTFSVLLEVLLSCVISTSVSELSSGFGLEFSSLSSGVLGVSGLLSSLSPSLVSESSPGVSGGVCSSSGLVGESDSSSFIIQSTVATVLFIFPALSL